MDALTWRSLVTYIVATVAESDGPMGRTKLTKLLYLIDLEHYRRTGAILTGLKWVFHHYGPYFMDLPIWMSRVDLDIPEETVETATGRRAIVPKLSRDIEPDERDLERRVGAIGVRSVSRVLEQWAESDLNPLLDFVYFHTEPMQDAKPGDTLDFSKAQRFQLSARLKAEVRVPQDVRDDFIRRLHSSRPAISKKAALNPPPRYDDVFYEGLAKDEGWVGSVPPGEVDNA